MAEVKTTCREELLAKLREDPVWDVVVIGGGTSGLEAACTAAEVGCRVTLIEREAKSAAWPAKSPASRKRAASKTSRLISNTGLLSCQI